MTNTKDVDMPLMIIGAMLMNIKVFSTLIIRHVANNGGTLDEESLNKFKVEAISNLKTSSTSGLNADQEARFFKSSGEALRAMLDETISEGLSAGPKNNSTNDA
jgi:hypothetical protein